MSKHFHKPKPDYNQPHSKNLLQSDMNPQLLKSYVAFVNKECGKLFNLINVADPDTTLAHNNRRVANLTNVEIGEIIGTTTAAEISKFRQSLGTEFMKQKSAIAHQGVLCCAHLESSYHNSLLSRLENTPEYLKLKLTGDPYELLKWIFTTFIHKSDKMTYLDVLHGANKELCTISQGPTEDINVYNARFDVLLNHYLRCRRNYIEFQLKKDSNNQIDPYNNGSLSIFDTLSMRRIIIPTTIPTAQDITIPGWNPANTTEHFLNNAILVHHYILSLNQVYSEAVTAFKNDSRNKLKYTDLSEAKNYIIGYVNCMRPSIQKPKLAYSTGEFKCFICKDPSHRASECPDRRMNGDRVSKNDSITISNSTSSDLPKKKKKLVKKDNTSK